MACPYDITGRPTKQILDDGTFTETIYDAHGPRTRQKTSQGWGVEIDYKKAGRQTAMEHIGEGHFYDSRPGEASSRFSQANSVPSRVKQLVQEAVALGEHSTNNHGDYRVMYTFDSIIGTGQTGRKTSTIEIFLDALGNVKNAYPY